MTYSVIQLTAANWGDLRSLRLAAIADSADIYGDLLVEQAEQPHYWQQLTEDQVWLALQDEQDLVGLVGVMESGPDRYGDFWIKSWWVAPERRGSGGTRLMLSWIEQHVGAAGGKEIALGVFDTNLAAISAFEALGFKSVGIRKPSTRPGAFYIIMSKGVTN